MIALDAEDASEVSEADVNRDARLAARNPGAQRYGS